MIITADMIEVVGKLYEAGCSSVEVAAKLGMSKQTFNRHMKTNLSLAEAVELGQTKYEAYFEQIGKDLIVGKLQGKDSLWKAFAQQKFGWSDKQQIDNTHSVSELTDAEIAEQIESRNKSNA